MITLHTRGVKHATATINVPCYYSAFQFAGCFLQFHMCDARVALPLIEKCH